MIEIISLILNAVLGSSFILFYTQEKRKRRAESLHAEQTAESVAVKNANESAVEWRVIAENREEKLIKKDAVIDRLYAEKEQERGVIHSMSREISGYQIEIANLTFKLCNKRGCADRNPPNELF